jgi:hypothetical protein
MSPKALQEKISANQIKNFFLLILGAGTKRKSAYDGFDPKKEPNIESFCNKKGGSSD